MSTTTGGSMFSLMLSISHSSASKTTSWDFEYRLEASNADGSR